MSSRGERRPTYNEATGHKVNVKEFLTPFKQAPESHTALTLFSSQLHTPSPFHAPPALSPDMQGTLLACCSAKLSQVLCWFKLWLSLGVKPCGLIKEKTVDIWWSLGSDGMQKVTLDCATSSVPVLWNWLQRLYISGALEPCLSFPDAKG